ncbi:MAG: response regulator [Candidatus Eisenbacteria bacterium]
MKASILIVEDDAELAEVARGTFSSIDYSVRISGSLEDAMKQIESEPPDVVVVSEDVSGGRGVELCQTLGRGKSPSETPGLVFLLGQKRQRQPHGLALLADAMLRKPVDPVALESAVEGLVLRRKWQTPLNPLTKLPGSVALAHEMEKRANAGRKFYVCTFRLNGDSANMYKRKYGELKFASVLKLAGRTIAGWTLTQCGRDAFVAHIGTLEEPEFVVLTDADKPAGLADAICAEFDVNVEPFYDRKDREEGTLVSSDSQGRRVRSPFVALEVHMESKEAERLGVPDRA